MIETVHGIVLRIHDLAEADARAALYTKEFGKIKANVAGIKKTASKLRSLTLPFAETRFQIYLHGAKRSGVHDPGKIIGGETLHYHCPLREDWERFIHTSALCETLDVMTRGFFPNPQEYALVSQTLVQMETTPHPILLRCRFVLSLLKILGYSLRHHAVWKIFSVEEHRLLNALAHWNTQETQFSDEESARLERITRSYLSRYLTKPLQTEIFRSKMEAAAV